MRPRKRPRTSKRRRPRSRPTDPDIPTKEYEPIVDEKTRVLTKDVNAAWKTLYDRQAPLLTWPETVQERFQKWGRKWPENVDAGRGHARPGRLHRGLKDYVDMVYKTFKPFDYETGEGIVAAPPKEVLLRPSVFSDEKVPGLGKIWSAQERLWIQRTLLEVVAQVNKNAKDWNTAIIRRSTRSKSAIPTPRTSARSPRMKSSKKPRRSLLPARPTKPAAAAAPTGSAWAG